MIPEFLKDSGSALITIAVVGLVGYATQIAALNKDIDQLNLTVADLKSKITESYTTEDALRDAADNKREVEIIYERMKNSDDRLVERINILDERVTATQTAKK